MKRRCTAKHTQSYDMKKIVRQKKIGEKYEERPLFIFRERERATILHFMVNFSTFEDVVWSIDENWMFEICRVKFNLLNYMEKFYKNDFGEFCAWGSLGKFCQNYGWFCKKNEGFVRMWLEMMKLS